MKKLWLVHGFVFIWAVVATALVMRVIPYPDWGHRAFAVKNEATARAVANILSEHGLGESFTFEAGDTVQTVLADNTTVLIQHKAETILPPSGLSVACDNPRDAATKALEQLRRAGLTADYHDDPIPGMEGKIVMVTSEGFEAWALVFRPSIFELGQPPNQRKIADQ